MSNDETPLPPFEAVLGSEAELRALYRRPSRGTATKKMSRIEPWVRVFIEATPFAFVATAGAASPVTVSPRGGEPGFVRICDDRRLVLADYAGNNLLDSMRNIIDSSAIGLLFLIPGRPETIRIDGDAWITTDPDLLDLTAQPRRRPKAAIGVLAKEVFFHCPSSFQRAKLWQPSSWRPDVTTPSRSSSERPSRPRISPTGPNLNPTATESDPTDRLANARVRRRRTAGAAPVS